MCYGAFLGKKLVGGKEREQDWANGNCLKKAVTWLYWESQNGITFRVILKAGSKMSGLYPMPTKHCLFSALRRKNDVRWGRSHPRQSSKGTARWGMPAGNISSNWDNKAFNAEDSLSDKAWLPYRPLSVWLRSIFKILIFNW